MLDKPAHENPVSATLPHAVSSSSPIERPNDIAESQVEATTDRKSTAGLAPERNTVIGADVVFTGELVAGSNIYIHGTLEGSIARDTENVVVGEKGRVKAMVHAKSIKVLGLVDGDIYGDEVVELMAGSRVNGNIFCPCVRLEKGAVFNGTIKMV